VRRRLVLVICFASLVGLLAAAFVYRAVMHRITVEAGKQGSEEIVVATVNMGVGESVTSRHVNLTPWPKSGVPQGALKKVTQAEGRVVRSSIVAGEPLIETKLIDMEAAMRTSLLPMLVPEGLRAVTITVDKAVEESGLVQPNSRVDVLVSLTRGSGEPMAKVILQNVPVIAAGPTVEMQDKKPVKVTTVTLALTPEQAERLALAHSSGKLMLATRHFGDNQAVATPGVTRATLLSQSPAVPGPKPTEARVAEQAPPAPKIKTHKVSVLRGGKLTDYEFTYRAGDVWVSANVP
jgi:pilus assembly protein CpaB